MNLKSFRDKVRYYRRLSGYSQQALAEAIGLYPTVLSAKLNGNDPAHLLTHPEIKRIVLTLAEWEAITRQSEAQELLELVNLKLSAFTPQEWKSSPLNRLEVLAPTTPSPSRAQTESQSQTKTKTSSQSAPATLTSATSYKESKSGLPDNINTEVMLPLSHQSTSTPKSFSLPLTTALPTSFSTEVKVSKPPTNLPAQLTSFVGRTAETQAICDSLQNPDVRLLTLTGPGGTGKTRLALHIATNLQAFFADGVFFVELAAIADPELVIPAIAQALGLKDGDQANLTQSLLNHLRERQLLLVLDNFEQVLEAGPALADLLTQAARLKIVVTSRSVLQLYGEHEYPVPPLNLPTTSAYLSVLAQPEKYSAIQLFVQRARAVRPDFTLSEENVKAVVEICNRLDGLPLAVELAAARCRLLTPQVMLPQLKRRLAFVTGGPRNLPHRQQTLRHTIEWSYNLLTMEEQQVFVQLGVFVGGFSLTAAQGICGELAGLFEIISTLAEKNLLKLMPTASSEPRFSMLETIREFAWEQLEKQQMLHTLQEAHQAYFLDWVEQIEPALHGAEQTIWAEQLEQEHDNLRAALQFALEQNQAEQAGRLGLGLNWFWYIHSHVSEGRRWLDKILKLAPALSTSLQAALLRVAGQLAHVQGDYQNSIPLLEQSISRYRLTSDKLNLALALRMRGVSALNTSDYSKARALLEEALELFRQLNHNWGITMTLTRLGQLESEQGEYELSRQLLEEALEVAQLEGDKAALGYAQLGLGWLALALGDYEQVQTLADLGLEQAQLLGDQNLVAWNLWNKAGAALGQGFYLAADTYARQSYNIWLSIDDKMGLALALTRQGAVAAAQEQFPEAESFYIQALKLWYEQQSRLFCAVCLEGLALVTEAQAQPERAVWLWKAATSLREELSTPLPPAELRVYQTTLARVSVEAREQNSNTLFIDESSPDLEQVLDYAFQKTGAVR
jgi:predicted ATPase/DNA-binding XRE family transcriptional regulator